MATPALELRGISKHFGKLVANDQITLRLHQGELLALLGENGAGKTTLMNILFGHYLPDAGSVVAFGKPLAPGNPRASVAAGIGMVHQHFALANNLTVLENITIGTEPLHRLNTSPKAAHAKILEISDRFGLSVVPEARVGDLSVGERQRVEILKSLYRNVRVLILDEPTAVLTPTESERFFGTLRKLCAEGLSLIFISHKLHEVMTAADRILVLRAGRIVAERFPAETSRGELAELMVGRRVTRPKSTSQPLGEMLLELRAVSLGAADRRTLDKVDLTLRGGEVLGIIGVAGNGQTALGWLLSGLANPAEGGVRFFGKSGPMSSRDLIEAGVARIPEDRHALGVSGELTVWQNAILERLRSRQFAKLGFVRRKAGETFATELIRKFDIRGASPGTETRLLSGGNLQKLILGRNLIFAPRLVIAIQPTRGLDEGAISAVHSELLSAKSTGAGVVLISEDLEEVMGLADRIQAIVKGRLSAPLAIRDADPKKLGLMMAGIWTRVENAA